MGKSCFFYSLIFSAILVLALNCPLLAVVTVMEPGYVAEVYATYNGGEDPRDLTFAENGKLYTVHRVSGKIWEITQDSSTVLTTLSGYPGCIVWAGGTSYGNYLYVGSQSRVYKVGLSGTSSNFAYVSNGAVGGIGIDTTGNYGNKMYITRVGDDDLCSVSTSGSVSVFSSLGSSHSDGGPFAVTFDTTGNFGNQMYLGKYWWGTYVYLSGLFEIDSSGNNTRVSTLQDAYRIAFDTMGEFDYDMFVKSKGLSGNPDGWGVWRVKPDGSTSKLVSMPNGPRGVAFGPDGAMYVSEYEDDVTKIIRISKQEPSVYTYCNEGVALELDGIDDYVTVPDNNVVEANEFTISAWANCYGPGGGINMQNPIFSQRDDTSANNHCDISLLADNGYGSASVSIRSSDGAANAVYAPAMDRNEWHHYAMTVDSDNLIFYIDSIEVGRTPNTQAGDYVTSIDYVEIGRNRYMGMDFGNFYGAIDDVIAYDRSLSAQEIEKLYCRQCSVDANLVAYWDFEENSGQWADDKSGNGNHAYFGNSPLSDNSDPIRIIYEPTGYDIFVDDDAFGDREPNIPDPNVGGALSDPNEDGSCLNPYDSI